jgi:DNA mismatch repair ATPase MutS
VLRGIHDIERLTGRLTTLLATPRDLFCLGNSLRELPRLMEILRLHSGPKPSAMDF